MIDDNLKWESNVKCTQRKISGAIGLLKYAKHYLQEDTLRNLYLSIVQPHFSYCCSVWGCCGATKLKNLQKLQNRAARIVTSSPFDTPAAPLLQLLRWPSIEYPGYQSLKKKKKRRNLDSEMKLAPSIQSFKTKLKALN